MLYKRESKIASKVWRHYIYVESADIKSLQANNNNNNWLSTFFFFFWSKKKKPFGLQPQHHKCVTIFEHVNQTGRKKKRTSRATDG